MKPIWLIAVVCLALAGCGNDVRSGFPSAAERFPRLTHAQWEATVQDLFHLPDVPGLATAFQPDPQLGRFDNNIARLGVTSSLWRDYQTAAEVIAERVVADPVTYKFLVPDPSGATARELVARFGLRAFRRPLTEAEVERYTALFDTAPPRFPTLAPFAAGVRLVVEGMLQSPHFLYRTELSDLVVDGAMPLGSYEVASRMSYLLWNSMPDDALFEAAAAGALDDNDGVRLAAERMFADPRARAQFRRFHFQALSISEYGDLDKNTEQFPDWRREIGPMMQEEALRFTDSILVGAGGVADLLTSTKAFVNADLAKIYGIQGTFGADYKEVALDPERRAGFLTRAGFLARNATLVDPDPIHRGVFINLNVICRPIAAPPSIPPVLDKKGNTNREKVESVTGAGTCGEACHSTMINPFGFAFESYDAVGAYRTTDRGYPINSADRMTLPSGRTLEFANAVDLSKQLAEAPEVHGCYAQQLLEFMLGRELNPRDQLVVADLAYESLHERLSIQQLALSVVASPTFRVRAVLKESKP